MQIAGSLAFLLAAGDSVPLLLLGVVLFGFGVGNATSLPPLIAQVEFVKEDVPRVVPMIVAIGQGTYAFAPAAFGLIGSLRPNWEQRRLEPRHTSSSRQRRSRGRPSQHSCSAVGGSIRHCFSVRKLSARQLFPGKPEEG